MILRDSTVSRVHLASPVGDDVDQFLAAVNLSRSLHDPWVSPPDTPEAFAEYVCRFSGDRNRGYFVRLSATDEIAGVINVSNMIHGALCCGFLGYYAMVPHNGAGLMKEGLHLVLADVFGRLGLNRVEANIQPGNAASLSLVEACGFRLEGFSPKYLKIGGQWRDHQRWALLSEEFQHGR